MILKMIRRDYADSSPAISGLRPRGLAAVLMLIVLSTLISSCEKNVTVKIPETEDEIVVEGYIETGTHPYVILSKSLPFFGTININNFIQRTIPGAVVTVDNGTFTDTLAQVISGYGIYSTLQMSGENGKSYKLKVEINGKTLTAVTTIPMPVSPDSVWFKVDGHKDSLGFVWAHLTDPDTLGNCYRWSARRINRYTFGLQIGQQKDSAFIAPLGSVFDDKFINNKSFDFDFPRGNDPNSKKEDDDNDEKFYFKKGDTIIVKFSSIDRDHFEFWRSEETQVNNNGNPFGSPAPVIGNINGALGIWGGYGNTFDTVYAH